MNKKIYSNLSIENLIKTDSFKQLIVEQKEELLKNSQWFNQFNKSLQEEILEGLKANLDISIYAKPEFVWYKMYQIRLGLLSNIDVSIYAKLEYNGYQMEQIRFGLENNVDISIYSNSEFDWKQMREIRLGLLRKIDVSKYINKKKSWQEMKTIRERLENEQKNIQQFKYRKLNKNRMV